MTIEKSKKTSSLTEEHSLFMPWYCAPDFALFWSLLQEKVNDGIQSMIELSDDDVTELTIALIEAADPLTAWEFITETTASDQLIALLLDAITSKIKQPIVPLAQLTGIEKLGAVQVSAAIERAKTFIAEALQQVIIHKQGDNHDHSLFF